MSTQAHKKNNTPRKPSENGINHPDASRALFDSLDTKAQGSITKKVFFARLQKAGILPDDPRIQDAVHELKKFDERQEISPEQFQSAIANNITIIERALKGNLVIPDFEHFCTQIKKMYTATKNNTDGKVADYIPQLAKVDPDIYALSICTVDGQRFNVGDFDKPYCVQSTCKPINYCLALEEHGEDVVHTHIGREPSGQGFNELTLNKNGLPHNPMINAGAIMACSLIQAKMSSAERLEYVLDRWQALTGGRRPGFDQKVYASERETADRNFALGYFMKEKGAFPNNTDLMETLELYFKCCSIKITVQDHATVAATLANAGICPVNGEKIVDSQTVKHCLSLMYSCGMYDFSGEFAFSVGIPAKSGVSGALFIVIPNVMGIAIWSPRLDDIGNSVRGLAFSQQLVQQFNFHTYDSVEQGAHKTDPRLQKNETMIQGVNMLCSAASRGDLNEIKLLVARGIDVNQGDYDSRTPLHLAASEGHASAIHYLVDRGAHLNPKDRWGGTPLDDALRGGHEKVIELLKEIGAKSNGVKGGALEKFFSDSANIVDGKDAVRLCWAASKGDLGEIERLVGNGIDLNVADYDGRTAMHLAASEGYFTVIRYLIDHGATMTKKDRWGGTPMDDAIRCKHKKVIELLKS